MRDFYDIYMLMTAYDPIDEAIFQEAIRATAANRGHEETLSRAGEVIERLSRSNELMEQWGRYLDRSPFVAEIEWDEIIFSLRSLFALGNLV